MTEKINIVAGEGVSQIIIREGKALEIFNPIPLNIKGTIDAPLRFIKNRLDLHELGVNCNVQVDQDKGSITLYIEETSKFMGTIEGTLVVNKDITDFGINDGRYYIPEVLADFLRLRKHLFKGSEQYMSVFSALRTFEAKINQELKAIKDDSGNFEQKKKQIVEHNLPKSFRLELPLYKGMPKVEIEVECLVNKALEVTMYSSDLIQMKEELKMTYLEDIMKQISEVAYELVIINI